jgi:uncharacterized membrane protein
MVVGMTALILVVILWASIEASMPTLIQVAFLIAVAGLYGIKRTIAKSIEDERTNAINQHATVATFSIFWVLFFTVSLGSVVFQFRRPLGFHLPGSPPPPPPTDGGPIGYLGLMQLGLLGLMIILYGGFRVYYARKFGEWETDEE